MWRKTRPETASRREALNDEPVVLGYSGRAGIVKEIEIECISSSGTDDDTDDAPKLEGMADFSSRKEPPRTRPESPRRAPRRDFRVEGDVPVFTPCKLVCGYELAPAVDVNPSPPVAPSDVTAPSRQDLAPDSSKIESTSIENATIKSVTTGSTGIEAAVIKIAAPQPSSPPSAHPGARIGLQQRPRVAEDMEDVPLDSESDNENSTAGTDLSNVTTRSSEPHTLNVKAAQADEGVEPLKEPCAKFKSSSLAPSSDQATSFGAPFQPKWPLKTTQSPPQRCELAKFVLPEVLPLNQEKETVTGPNLPALDACRDNEHLPSSGCAFRADSASSKARTARMPQRVAEKCGQLLLEAQPTPAVRRRYVEEKKEEAASALWIAFQERRTTRVSPRLPHRRDINAFQPESSQADDRLARILETLWGYQLSAWQVVKTCHFVVIFYGGLIYHQMGRVDAACEHRHFVALTDMCVALAILDFIAFATTSGLLIAGQYVKPPQNTRVQ